MDQIALIVEYETLPGKEAEFDRILRDHAAACLNEEPGVLRFDVLRPLDENNKPIPNKFMANELFVNHAAVASHRATPRWQRIAEVFKALLVNRRPVLCQFDS